MNKYYTGIGSRETPKEILDSIFNIAVGLAQSGYILRSGGADGADKAFEDAHSRWNKNAKEIFVPWKGFNGSKSELLPSKLSFEIAEMFHPAWSKLTNPVKALMARNVHQVLGKDLATPSDFVICWTKDGKDIGGTALAIRLARANNIPVINLGK